jgi:hypothetical protein
MLAVAAVHTWHSSLASHAVHAIPIAETMQLLQAMRMAAMPIDVQCAPLLGGQDLDLGALRAA